MSSSLQHPSFRDRSSSSSKHRSVQGGSGSRKDKSGPRDQILFEVKKERRNIELENEKALREIERRREREKMGEEGDIGGRHRKEKRSHRDRDRDRGERHRNRPPSPDEPMHVPEDEEIVEEKDEEEIDEMRHLEVQVG